MRAHAVHSLERCRRHLLAVIVSAHRQHCRRVLDPLLLHGRVSHTHSRVRRTLRRPSLPPWATIPSLHGYDNNNNNNNVIIIPETASVHTKYVSMVPMKYNLTVAAFCSESKGFCFFPPDYITILY